MGARNNGLLPKSMLPIFIKLTYSVLFLNNFLKIKCNAKLRLYVEKRNANGLNVIGFSRLYRKALIGAERLMSENDYFLVDLNLHVKKAEQLPYKDKCSA